MTASSIPENPELTRRSLIARHSNRLTAGVLFFVSTGVLGLAAWLEPSAAGIGTHRQMGLPPCQFEQMTGLPCATCGCTTSFAHAADGSLIQSFINQPFGAVLAVLTAVASLVTGYALVTNLPLAPIGRVLGSGRVVVLGLGLLLAAWAYKIIVHLG